MWLLTWERYLCRLWPHRGQISVCIFNKKQRMYFFSNFESYKLRETFWNKTFSLFTSLFNGHPFGNPSKLTPLTALTPVAGLNVPKKLSDPVPPVCHTSSRCGSSAAGRLHRHSSHGSSFYPITPRFLRPSPQRFWHLDPIGDQTHGHEHGLGDELLIGSVCSCLGLQASRTPPPVGCLFWLLL